MSQRVPGRPQEQEGGPRRILEVSQEQGRRLIASLCLRSREGDSSPRYASFLRTWEETHRLVMPLRRNPGSAVGVPRKVYPGGVPCCMYYPGGVPAVCPRWYVRYVPSFFPVTRRPSLPRPLFLNPVQEERSISSGPPPSGQEGTARSLLSSSQDQE